MRTCLALICVLVLLASPSFFAYLEAERLLGRPETMYRWFDPWVPFVMVLCTSVVTLTLPWIIGLFGDDEDARL